MCRDLLVSGTSSPSARGISLRLWHPVTWACVRELAGHCGAVLSLAVCGD